jgi:putative membrane protein
MLWIKAFHIISVITWFAAIFYLPRLFVYHAMSKDQISIERFKVMERKLYNGIMTPSAVAVIVFGFWLLSYGIWGTWMVVKLVLVALTLIYHGWCGYTIRQFRLDQNTHSHKYFRLMNELPVFLMIPIVILVVVKPF